MKTSELTGAALDWAVGKAEYTDGRIVRAEKNWRGNGSIVFVGMGPDTDQVFRFDPSTHWSQGGPIIERESIGTDYVVHDPRRYRMWRATSKKLRDYGQMKYTDGPTPLIAAMRCFVASKLGEEVDVPEELCK